MISAHFPKQTILSALDIENGNSVETKNIKPPENANRTLRIANVNACEFEKQIKSSCRSFLNSDSQLRIRTKIPAVSTVNHTPKGS